MSTLPDASAPIERRRLSDMVAARIRDHIIEHGLEEGDRLPTEQEMAEMFGVSRISVREATRALSFLGIIRSAPRRGLTIGRIDMQRVTAFLEFHLAVSRYPRRQLLQTRLVIESGALPYAMDRIAADRQRHQRLVQLNDQLRGATDLDEFIAGDVAFHRGLLEASGIEPLVAFNGILEVFFRRFRRDVLRVQRRWSEGIEGHDQLLEALRRRRLATAQKLLRDHLAHYGGQDEPGGGA